MPIFDLATFQVSFLQVIDEKGQVDRTLEPDLPQDKLIELYRTMVLSREVDQRMLKLQRQGRLGTFPPCSGQEAAACAPTFALRSTDWLVPTYRELGARLIRGEPIEKTLLYYNGYEEGSHLPEGSRTLPIQVILGSQLPHAVGLAYAARQLGEEETAVLAFFGDGSSSQGDFHEALNFAGVWKVPVVFVCQNNGWAISHPREAQTRSETIAQKAIAYGFPGVQVDGNDALALYRATKEALDRARMGEGPTLIEAVTYRLMMHTTADDPHRYRTREEEEEWKARDPLLRFRIYLEEKGVWNKTLQESLEAEIKKEVGEAVKRLEATTGSGVKLDAPFDHLFEEPPWEIERQRQEFLANLKQEVADA